jgi:hypothetical protein
MNTSSYPLRIVQVLVCLVVFLSGAACLEGHISPAIYTDQPGPGWENWSWDCSCNFRSTTETHDDSRYAIAAGLSAWGGLGIGRHGPVSTAGFDRLEFYIHGGDAGGQQLRISLENESGAELPTRGGIELNDPLYLEGGQIQGGKWQRVSIPLEDLGAEDTQITKINIMDNTGQGQATFYVDDIVLVKQ